jgi:exonuclease SbcD
MRFLHTGDWHVGKTIRGRSRIEEFRAVTQEIVGIATAEAVDVVLIAGDLYEQRSPTAEADAVVFEAFLSLHDAGIPSVVIPGNHDSAVRLEALGGLLRHVGARVVPKVVPPHRGSVAEVPSRDGSEGGLVACVPFVPARRFADAVALFRGTEAWFQDYAEGMGRVLEAMAAAFRPDRVNLLMAHLYTDGALIAGSEREVTIGMEYAVAPSRLPTQAAYAALGHIHRPQAVRGTPCPARYAGSPLQLDFGEAGQAKSVTIIEGRPGAPAQVREVPLTTGRSLITVEGTLDQIMSRAEELAGAYLRVAVETDGPVPGIADRIRQVLPDAVDIRLTYERKDEEPEKGLASLSPRDQFVSYYRAAHGSEPADELMGAFDRVLEDVGEES